MIPGNSELCEGLGLDHGLCDIDWLGDNGCDKTREGTGEKGDMGRGLLPALAFCAVLGKVVIKEPIDAATVE